MARPYHLGQAHWEMPVADWPAADREAWLRACASPGFLKARRPAARWAPSTRHRVERSYGRFLGWLVLVDQLDRDGTPAGRMARPNLEVFVVHLVPLNAPRSVITVLDGLSMFSRALGLDTDLAYLREAQAELRHDCHDQRDKALRLRHAVELLELGAELMAGTPYADRLVRQATRYRDGLAIAFLAMRPLRLANLMGLRVGDELRRVEERWWIMIPAAQTKNRRPIEVPFPPLLVAELDIYLTRVRPLLRGGAGNQASTHLWIGEGGGGLSANRMRQTICARTKAAFGRPVCPHLFRDCVATTIALDDPEHVRIAAQVLGHGSFATTERHYRMSRMAEATRAYGAVLDGIMQKGAGDASSHLRAL
jgi:integrase